MQKEMQLPTKRVKQERVNPSRFIIYAPPKQGKTTVISALDDTLIVDTEDGTKYAECMSVQVNNVDDLRNLREAIVAAEKPYKRIALDTVTELEEIVLPIAKQMYQKTPMGRNYQGDDIRTLPQGAGYHYHRLAFESVISEFEKLCETVILIAHVKDKMIESKTSGEPVVGVDISLTGKLAAIQCAKADAIGYFYRKGADGYLSFETNNFVCGARPEHLSGRKFKISEQTDDSISVNWSEIFS